MSATLYSQRNIRTVIGLDAVHGNNLPVSVCANFDLVVFIMANGQFHALVDNITIGRRVRGA